MPQHHAPTSSAQIVLIGLDVGFSATKSTSGIAMLVGQSPKVGRATAAAESRARLLMGIERSVVTAVDAPITPELDGRLRICERVFASGRFQKRCKAGFSHVRGTGQELRRAGFTSASQLIAFTGNDDLAVSFPKVWLQSNIVEAFPNAFLGVCLSDDVYSRMPVLRRGRKFDWLYDRWCERRMFAELVSELDGLLPPSFTSSCVNDTDHEHRAALVCLATAACVTAGKYTAAGDIAGGYFFLPPWSLWAEWSQSEIEIARTRFESLSIWLNGEVY